MIRAALCRAGALAPGRIGRGRRWRYGGHAGLATLHAARRRSGPRRRAGHALVRAARRLGWLRRQFARGRRCSSRRSAASWSPCSSSRCSSPPTTPSSPPCWSPTQSRSACWAAQLFGRRGPRRRRMRSAGRSRPWRRPPRHPHRGRRAATSSPGWRPTSTRWSRAWRRGARAPHAFRGGLPRPAHADHVAAAAGRRDRRRDRRHTDTRASTPREWARTSRALSALIDDLFELTRLETGELTWTMEQVELDALVRETVEAMRPQAEARLRVDVRADCARRPGRDAREPRAAAARPLQPHPERDPAHAAPTAR